MAEPNQPIDQLAPPPLPAKLPRPQRGGEDAGLTGRLRAVEVRTDDLVKLRVVFVALVRLAGLMLAFMSLFPFAWWLAEGLADGDLWWLGYYWPRITAGSVMLFGGMATVFFGGLIGRFLLRTRGGPVACPMCRFELTSLDQGRCTECGYEVTPALPRLAMPPMERVCVARMIAAACVRGFAVVLLVIAAIRLIQFLAEAMFPDVFVAYWDDGSAMYYSLANGVALAAIGLALLLAAGPIAAVLVPKAWARKLAESREP